jgi:formylglycine-generating enzyme required for sulfatase activity
MKNLLTLLLCFLTAQAYTQNIKNVTFRQGGEIVHINYDITGATNGQTFEIAVYCSTDGGRTYGNALKAVSGDVGKDIISGNSKTIIWRATEELTTLESDKVTFKVIAKVKNTVPEDFVFIPGGTFQMGSNDGGSDEKPVHSVTVSSFYMSKYEVTQKQWRDVMGTNPSGFKCDNCPVEQVSWNDVQKFLKKQNAKTGKNYRLPTEAEWEYAARGGNKSKGYKYAGSNSINDMAWYSSNSTKTHQVGTKKANELGIYDMSGNVYEWCSDWYDSDYYKNSLRNNPQGANSGTYRVLRGGSWSNYHAYCRVADRPISTPTYRNNNIGFRLVFP